VEAQEGTEFPETVHHGGNEERVHDTSNSVTQVRHVEVYEQPHFMSAEFQIRQDLRHMKREQFLNSLQFQDDAIFDQEIDAVPSIDANAVVHDWHPDLMVETHAILSQLIANTCVIGAFETPRSQGRMNFDGGRQNPVRDLLVKHKRDSLPFLHSSVVEIFCHGEIEEWLQSPVL